MYIMIAEQANLAAVQQNRLAIQHIDHPSEAVQLVAKLLY